MNAMTPNKDTSDMPDMEKGYRVTIGRDTVRVVSVFRGTKTASEAIHEAAIKKILFEKAAG